MLRSCGAVFTKKYKLKMKPIEKLNRVLEHVKETFVGKDEIIDLLGISLLAKEMRFC